MPVTTIKLVTIIAEGVLKERLIADIRRLGARGYTISEVHGHGTRGVSNSFWDGAQIKLETLVGPLPAEQILNYLSEHYFTDYSIVAYVHDVDVIRGEKYL